MAKTCLEKFNSILEITALVASICGMNVMNPKWTVNYHTWIVIIAVNAFYACTIYTIYIGFAVYDDWTVLLQCLCLAGGATQGYSKLVFGIRHYKAVRIIVKDLLSIYIEFQNDEDFLPILRYRIGLTTKLLKIAMCMYITSIGPIVLYPLIHNYLSGQNLLIMQFYLPFVDATTHSGYLIHNSAHTFLMFLGAFGNFAGDMYIFITVTHVPLFKDVLKIKCKKFNRIILQRSNPKETKPLALDLAHWHQKYNKYAGYINETYYAVIFIEIACAVVSISCTLFSIVLGSWPAAFTFLLYGSSALYAYCGLGQLVELSNDEVIDVFYSDCLWYELPVPEQKIILLMIRKAQSPTTLTVGQIMPLSMSTALQLTKAIYSYLMMLLSFLETDEM